MSLQQVPAGRDFPDDINVIIEVPMNLRFKIGSTLGPELPGHVPDAPMR